MNAQVAIAKHDDAALDRFMAFSNVHTAIVLGEHRDEQDFPLCRNPGVGTVFQG
jgi:hypothetical protein